MTPFAPSTAERLPWYLRLVLIVSGAMTLGVLLLAFAVQPDDRGLGTHEQFGLPPCTFRQIFGWPCPSCGMTTSWAALVRGNLGKALSANPGGVFLALLAATAGPWMLVSGIRGRWWGGYPSEVWVAVLAAAFVATTVGAWIYKICL